VSFLGADDSSQKYKALDHNGMFLKDNPNVKVEIGGHSDGKGLEAANQTIAEKRAQSAKKYIQNKHNIPENRMTVKSYGSSKPVADDKTAEGRAKNRRAEFMIMKQAFGPPVAQKEVVEKNFYHLFLCLIRKSLSLKWPFHCPLL